MNILITGAAGFVGSHVVRFLLKNTDWNVIALVRMQRAGDLKRLENTMNNKRLQIIWHDMNDRLDVIHHYLPTLDYCINIAADSHVDYSIQNPRLVYLNNTRSVINLLEYLRFYQPTVKKVIQYSTDEVYGDVDEDYDCLETDALNPKNPYSASKAAGDMVAISYVNTYKMPIIITRTMNMFGEMQNPEKMIPKCIKHIRENERMPIHQIHGYIGTRHWLYVDESADSLFFLLQSDIKNEIYNIKGTIELNNLEIAKAIAQIMRKKLRFKMVDITKFRPGYDRRYTVNDNKIRKLGWKPKGIFKKQLEKTIKWYLKNPIWLT